MSLISLFSTLKGGPRSGNFAHAGNPPNRGGSASVSTRDSVGSIREEYTGVPFIKDSVEIVGYRIGNTSDPHKRGIFFSGDKEGADEYGSIHEGEETKKYKLNLENVLIAGHQSSVTKLFFNKPYGDMHTGGVEGGRKLDRKILAEAKKRGIKAIIYTKPALPAEFEIMVSDSKNIMEI